jgi:uncharacterized membrane protein
MMSTKLNPSVTRDELIAQIAEAPLYICAAAMQYLYAVEARHAAERSLALMKARLEVEVSGERGDDGKPVYSNETARKAVVEEMLAVEGADVVKEAEEAKSQERRREIDAQLERDKLRALEAIARLMGGDG